MSELPAWSAVWRHLTSELAPVSFRQRVALEDFVVDELLDDDTGRVGGDGTHVHFRIEKRGVDTRGAIARLARELGRRPVDFGYAGLKDARAVARQTLSLEHVDPERLAGLDLGAVRVLDVRRRDRKLKVGALRGNRFELVLRDVEPEGDERIGRALAVLRARGLPNYYGPQRFGGDGSNPELGRALLERRFDDYLARLFENSPRARELDRARRLRERAPGDALAAVQAVPASLRRIHLAGLQALVFNRVLAARVHELDSVRAGDLAFLHASRGLFPVEDAARESERAARFELSPSGPFPGWSCPVPAGEPGRIEARAHAELGVDPAAFRGLGGGMDQKGARRPLRVRVDAASCERAGPDLRLAFSLPKGAYASVLLEELEKRLAPRDAPGDRSADPVGTPPSGDC